MRALQEKGAVTLSAFGRPAFTYRTEKTEFPAGRDDLQEIFHRGGYIHPVLSPTGKQVTDDYPVNHKHHHGIWFAWTHTEFEGRKPGLIDSSSRPPSITAMGMAGVPSAKA